jgi:pyridoxal phosphate enzyme (YggS family)
MVVPIPESVEHLAIEAKQFPGPIRGADAVEAAVAAGLVRIGENYAQEAVAKISECRTAGLRFESHFIGHIQTNKVRSLVPVVDVWQSVDRESVVLELARRAKPGTRLLVQVNATGEGTKSGCPPDTVPTLVDLALTNKLAVEGLMTIGPTDGDPGRTRAAFRTTRALVDRLGLTVCSMGMSSDLEIAVNEGATLLRVGTALFGDRPPR